MAGDAYASPEAARVHRRSTVPVYGSSRKPDQRRAERESQEHSHYSHEPYDVRGVQVGFLPVVAAGKDKSHDSSFGILSTKTRGLVHAVTLRTVGSS